MLKLTYYLNNKPLEKTNYVVEIQEDLKDSILNIELIFKTECMVSNLYVDISFDSTIESWRNHDYEWVQVKNQRWIANEYAPKIVRLRNGKIIVAKNTVGCWEYDAKKKILRWHFIHPMLNPTMLYVEGNKRLFLDSQTIQQHTKIETGILITENKVEEFARTPIGFKSIVCFTDHCDFDTDLLLEKQRDLFRQNGIKTSKGLFLYKYSHKDYTVSFENDATKQELVKWQNEGHELVYHALSQSFDPNESFEQFQNFESPDALNPITCYIDHGYQPYNYTKQKEEEIPSWYLHMAGKKVNLIWNYIDSGEGNLFTINQINPKAFTLKNIFKSSKLAKQKLNIKRAFKTDIRNWLMYGVDEEFLLEVKNLGGLLKGKRVKNLPSKLFKIFKHFAKRGFWQKIFNNDEVFEFSKFGPVFFDAINQQQTKIQVFQSVAIRDFDICFSDLALTDFIKDKGVLIAHTYFAFTGKNHEGRLFETEAGEYRKLAKEGFVRLGEKIKNEEIWNPTISEMKAFFDTFKTIEYSFNAQGDVVISNFNGIKRLVE